MGSNYDVNLYPQMTPQPNFNPVVKLLTPWRLTIYLHRVSEKKLCHCYFLNNSVKHWPTLIIFGMQHCQHREKKLDMNDSSPPHLIAVATILCEMQKS